MLAHPSGARVELAFRNNSLTISGNVRVVQHVRKIGVDIPRSWQSLRKGWYETYVEVSNGLHPLCSSSLLVENYSKTVGNSFKLTPTCNTRVW